MCAHDANTPGLYGANDSFTTNVSGNELHGGLSSSHFSPPHGVCLPLKSPNTGTSNAATLGRSVRAMISGWS